MTTTRSGTKYEVQTYAICGGWANTWTISEEGGEPESEVFSTREEAQAELDEFLGDIQGQIDRGERDPDEGYDAADYRIVPVPVDGGVEVT